MKKNLVTGLMLLAAVFFTSAAPSSAVTVTDYSAGDAAGGIAGSRHNLGPTGVHIMTYESGFDLCVFCHAPHGGGSGTSPLWNRSTTNSSSYTAYGTTISGTNITNADLGSSTLACLSCHDGVTTFDNIVNAPGAGGGGDQGWTFYEDGTVVSDFITSERLTIGLSLANDHPVSVTYNEDVASLRVSSTNLSMIDLSSGLTATNANLMQNLWAVRGLLSTDTTIGDLLRLNTSTGTMTVECSSCHDPHFSNKSYDEVEWTWGGEADSDGLFLRRVGGNSGSGVCRTCHNK